MVAALAQMPADAFDASKVHLFFANEKIPSYPCKEGGLDAAKKGALASLPDSLVDKLGQGSPDMFFSAALTQTAAKAACASGRAEV